VALAAHALGVRFCRNQTLRRVWLVKELRVTPWKFCVIPKTEDLPQKKVMIVGNPIRQNTFNGRAETAIKLFNLSGRRHVILVLGGSQGARRINDKILDILPALLKDYEVIHQTGQKNIATAQKEATLMMTNDQKPYYHAYGF